MPNENDVLFILGEIKGELKQISDRLTAGQDRMNRIDEDIENAEKRLGVIEKVTYAGIVVAGLLWTVSITAMRKFF